MNLCLRLRDEVGAACAGHRSGTGEGSRPPDPAVAAGSSEHDAEGPRPLHLRRLSLETAPLTPAPVGAVRSCSAAAACYGGTQRRQRGPSTTEGLLTVYKRQATTSVGQEAALPLIDPGLGGQRFSLPVIIGRLADLLTREQLRHSGRVSWKERESGRWQERPADTTKHFLRRGHIHPFTWGVPPHHQCPLGTFTVSQSFLHQILHRSDGVFDFAV